MNDQIDYDQVCEDCNDTGFVYERVDVDVEKRVPCECGLGDPNE